jgi:hypothetical protein
MCSSNSSGGRVASLTLHCQQVQRLSKQKFVQLLKYIQSYCFMVYYYYYFYYF